MYLVKHIDMLWSKRALLDLGPMPGSKQPGIAAFFAKTHKMPCKATQQGARLSGCKRKDRQDAADVPLMHYGMGNPVLIDQLFLQQC